MELNGTHAMAGRVVAPHVETSFGMPVWIHRACRQHKRSFPPRLQVRLKLFDGLSPALCCYVRSEQWQITWVVPPHMCDQILIAVAEVSLEKIVRVERVVQRGDMHKGYLPIFYYVHCIVYVPVESDDLLWCFRVNRHCAASSNNSVLGLTWRITSVRQSIRA